MKSKSIHGASFKEVDRALNSVLTDGFTPTVAFVFISVKQDRKAICELMTSKKIEVFGATSCGEFINGHQTEGEIAILLLELAKEHYTILFENMEDGNMDNAVSKLANNALNQFTNPSLIVCGPGINQN